MTTPSLPKPATAPLDKDGVLAGLLANPQRVMRDTLLAAMSNLPADKTCGDCNRCYTTENNARAGRCSAFPPVSFVLDGKMATRDPMVNFERPACVLFSPIAEASQFPRLKAPRACSTCATP